MEFDTLSLHVSVGERSPVRLISMLQIQQWTNGRKIEDRRLNLQYLQKFNVCIFVRFATSILWYSSYLY